MSTDPAISSTAPTTPGLSQVERVVDTFIAPSRTFKDILRDASWWMPLLLIAILSVAQAFVVDRQVGFDQVTKNQIHSSPRSEERLDQLSPEQKATQLELSAKITKVISYAIPIVLAIFFAIYALIVWAAFNFGYGARTTFGQVFAVTCYGALPYLLRSVVVIITLLAGSDAESFNQQNPVGTNLAYYLPDAAPWLKAMLMQFDIVAIWSLILVVIGMSIVARKTIAQSAVIVVGFWLLTVALSTGAAAIFN